VIGPEDGDAAGIAKESGGGFVADPADEKAIEDAILKIYHLFKSEKTIVQRDIIDRFSREYLAGELAKLMNEIIN
jgi:glycosyltransferase involved in cell wall biosynthesis